jgi:S-adenosylmethionine:tRNA ribosyltransferase-isomerase
MNLLFNYELPARLIAQQPAAERDASRLMTLQRTTGKIGHRRFRDLTDLLRPGDLLVLNDSRVLPARLIGKRAQTGGQWEGLFLRELPDETWELLAQTKGKPVVGETFLVERGPLRLTLSGKSDGHWLMAPSPAEPAADLLRKHGRIPLPPYIRKGRAESTDRERYQTVYARSDGSVAAPTAGLHFTEAIFAGLRQRGVGMAYVTLHVGLGTFEPIRGDDPARHVMHHEWADVPASTVDAIRECTARGGRVISVGTTATRALESAAAAGELRPWRGETNLFIHEPYAFKVVDGLITNFHLPRTTLLMLVGAFAGTELLRRAYEIAVAMEYRFFSYGDAMLIV